MKDGAHIINLDKYNLLEAHWNGIGLYFYDKNVTYFDSF